MYQLIKKASITRKYRLPIREKTTLRGDYSELDTIQIMERINQSLKSNFFYDIIEKLGLGGQGYEVYVSCNTI